MMAKLLPVIHTTSDSQAIRNIEKCINANTDGCFLINHSIDSESLFFIYHKCKIEFPDFWIGVNDLTGDTVATLNRASSVDGLWVDNVSDIYFCSHAFTVKRDFPIFGGVEFKYQKYSISARTATESCDVITTSGDKTGSPPTLEKIQRIKDEIGKFPLAIASGIDYNNVGQFLPYVDYFLVATSISSTFDELSEYKLKELKEKIN